MAPRTPSTVTIRRTTADDWQQLRDLRLEMLEDTPLAYGETLSTGLARGQTAHSVLLAAIDDETGDWVGTMGGYLDAPGSPMLVGVYVRPSHRGKEAGVADALLDTVVEWARSEGAALTLHVHEDNPRAVAYYRRRGFEPTGVTVPYVLDPESRELELRLPLG
jgi:GNAT superfamily N-acetyltransferase